MIQPLPVDTSICLTLHHDSAGDWPQATLRECFSELKNFRR
jgi:hypothetical protein